MRPAIVSGIVTGNGRVILLQLPESVMYVINFFFAKAHDLFGAV